MITEQEYEAGLSRELKLMYLRQRQSLPLSIKIRLTQRRIAEFYEKLDGKVYVSFSGGKDSTVLLDIVRGMYTDVPAVFSDTGLEYPEIRDFVKTIDNVITVRPKKSFKQVIEEHGYPVVSKKASKLISAVQNPTGKNQATINLAKTGLRRDGEKATTMRLGKKWHKLFDAPFKVSDKCCEWIKKKPIAEFAKQSKMSPITGIMAEESDLRQSTWLRTGCNSFSNGFSMPMAFWTEQDVLQYLKEKQVPYSPIYGDIVEVDGKLKTTGERRTGCMFCMFGVHMEKGTNRFQRMKLTHPQYWDYCINKLGLKEVLEYIGVPYE